MEINLHPISEVNLLVKYADDTNLLVPENTDVSLDDEFTHIKERAAKNSVNKN